MQSHQLPTPLLIVILWFTLIALILYLLTVGNALKKCAPASRTMKPGKVWLLLIPVFGLVWHFVIIMNVAKSLGNEFARLGVPRPEPTLGKNIGLATCVGNCCLVIPIPLLRDLAAIPAFVLWGAYWAKIAKYSKVLDAHQATTLVQVL
jgi:hypothetical protein